jgi:hypothetical protein
MIQMMMMMNGDWDDKHRLSDQVGQLQSKINRAALHRDLIVGMELQKKGPSREWLPERASLVQTAGGGARRKTLSNLSKADITNLGSDIGKNNTTRISCLDDTISETAISGHTLIHASRVACAARPRSP